MSYIDKMMALEDVAQKGGKSEEDSVGEEN